MSTFPTHVDTVALSRRLNSSDEMERQQAREELFALIADDARRIHQCRALQVSISMTSILLYLAAWGYTQFFSHQVISAIYPLLAMIGIGSGFLAQSQAKKAISNIAALDIPQVVGALLDVYGMNGRFVLGDTRPALIRLLPRLQASDMNLISTQQRKLLYGILSINEEFPWHNRYWSAELKIAILRALEQIGDEKAIPSVTKAARLARNPQVRTAAQECLPYLTVRAEQARVEQTLLRASASTASPDTLLRPTVATAPTEPQQLLRASHTENDANSA